MQRKCESVKMVERDNTIDQWCFTAIDHQIWVFNICTPCWLQMPPLPRAGAGLLSARKGAFLAPALLQALGPGPRARGSKLRQPLPALGSQWCRPCPARWHVRADPEVRFTGGKGGCTASESGSWPRRAGRGSPC